MYRNLCEVWTCFDIREQTDVQTDEQTSYKHTHLSTSLLSDRRRCKDCITVLTLHFCCYLTLHLTPHRFSFATYKIWNCLPPSPPPRICTSPGTHRRHLRSQDSLFPANSPTHSVTISSASDSCGFRKFLNPQLTNRNYRQGAEPGGLGDGSPPAGSRGGAPVRVWGKAPRICRHILKITIASIVSRDRCINTDKKD